MCHQFLPTNPHYAMLFIRSLDRGQMRNRSVSVVAKAPKSRLHMNRTHAV